MNLKLIIVELCLPVVVWLGLILAVPHIIAKSIVPQLGKNVLPMFMNVRTPDCRFSVCCGLVHV